jgi:hypothetical protein
MEGLVEGSLREGIIILGETFIVTFTVQHFERKS